MHVVMSAFGLGRLEKKRKSFRGIFERRQGKILGRLTVDAGCHGFGVRDKAVRFRRNFVVRRDLHGDGLAIRIAPRPKTRPCRGLQNLQNRGTLNSGALARFTVSPPFNDCIRCAKMEDSRASN